MKIRNGFVSNSSSSSYVIKLNNKSIEACPTCGHKPEDILDIIRNRYCDYETGVDWDDIDEYINILNGDLVEECNYLAELSMRDPNESLYRDSSYTVKEGMPNVEDRIKNLRERIKEIEQLKSEGACLAGIEISYHDEYAQHVLNECVERGTITIVEDWS